MHTALESSFVIGTMAAVGDCLTHRAFRYARTYGRLFFRTVYALRALALSTSDNCCVSMTSLRSRLHYVALRVRACELIKLIYVGLDVYR